MPARPWTASTTPSALSAVPVVSAPATQAPLSQHAAPAPTPAPSRTLSWKGAPVRTRSHPVSPACLSECYLAFPPLAGSTFWTYLSASLLFSEPPFFFRASLLAQPWAPAPPLLGEVWSWAARVAWGDSERLECGKGGCGLGEWGAVGGSGRGFSLGWSEFSHLTRVEATRPCQADDITLQECLLLLLAQEALCGGAPPTTPSLTSHYPFTTAYPF